MASRAIGFTLLLLICSSYSQTPVIPDEDWAYVDVRPSAHMFWWLYGCTDTTKNREQVPLVMWLQGGPGGSSTGFGNFIEIGPLDVNLKPRNTSWTQAANVLFVDNPVGTGYSYVDTNSAYTTDVEGIAKDLLTLFSAFLKKHTVFQHMPFYIFCESYGGKMTAVFAEVLQKAITAGSVTTMFQGIALGDSWISAIDYVNTWGPYLFATSLVNQADLVLIQKSAALTQAALENGEYANSTDLWSKTQDVVENVTDDVNFYNILQHHADEVTSLKSGLGLPRLLKRYQQDSLSELMNGPIKKKLNIPDKVVWGAQSGEVFEKQKVDFMKDVIATVDSLLSMGVNVTIYNGQLDLICCTQGTIAWMNKLKWPGLADFKTAKRTPVYPDTDPSKKRTGAFYQAYKNLAFYWILNAGHMVPLDNGDTALTMLRRVIQG